MPIPLFFAAIYIVTLYATRHALLLLCALRHADAIIRYISPCHADIIHCFRIIRFALYTSAITRLPPRHYSLLIHISIDDIAIIAITLIPP